MTDLLAALDAAGRSLFDAADLPDGWDVSFCDACTGAIANVTVYVAGPGDLLMRIRHEPEANLFGVYSVSLRRGGVLGDETRSAPTMPALAEAIRAMLDGAG
jgi:hypothetical protein